jgi:hypothetical protein
MANSEKHDLRNGRPGAEPLTNTQMPGHHDEVMPMSKSVEHAVNPGFGSKAGVAEGQVTKSN